MSGADMCEYSSRKWCSTDQATVEAELVRQLDYLDGLVEDLRLAH